MTTRLWAAIALSCSLSIFANSQSQTPSELSLSDAIRFALKHSPALEASRAEVAAARAEVGMARGKGGPQLSANGFYSKSDMPTTLSSAGGVEPNALIMAPDKDYRDFNLSFMVPLYTGGIYSGLVASSIALRSAAMAETTGMEAEVALKVRESYLRAVYLKELVTAFASRVRAAEGMAANAQTRFNAGSGIEATVRRAEAELAEARKDLKMTENDRQKMLLELLAEMGSTMDSMPTLTEKLEFKQPNLNLAQSLVDADKTRGELLSARLQVMAAKGKASSAAGALKPQIYGFAMKDFFSPTDGMGKSSGYSFGITVSLPVFDSGMRRSEVAATKAMVERAQAEADRWKLVVEREVRQAWLDIETASQNYSTALAALKGAESAFEVISIRVETGKSILVEQLDALATLTKARANVAQALFEHEIAVAKLDRAIGVVGDLARPEVKS